MCEVGSATSIEVQLQLTCAGNLTQVRRANFVDCGRYTTLVACRPDSDARTIIKCAELSECARAELIGHVRSHDVRPIGYHISDGTTVSRRFQAPFDATAARRKYVGRLLGVIAYDRRQGSMW